MTVTTDRVEQLLAHHGYRKMRHTGQHTLYEHHGDRIVIPLHAGELSPWSARVIEWSLEPRLGRGWLTAPLVSAPAAPTVSPAPTPGSVALNLVIRPEPDRTAWNAFVVEEPRILTFTTTLREVRGAAADACEAWFADAAAVELEPRLQLDAETRRWIAPAGSRTRSAAQTTEARRELLVLGYRDADVDALLDWPVDGN